MNNQTRDRDALIAHINALDTVIRDRNRQIAELTEKLKEPVDLPAATEKKIQAAYLKGFKACYRAVQQQTQLQRNQLLNALWEIIE